MDRPQVSQLLDDMAHLIRRSIRLREQGEFIEKERQRIDREIARAYKVVRDAVTGARLKQAIDDAEAENPLINELEADMRHPDVEHQQAS